MTLSELWDRIGKIGMQENDTLLFTGYQHSLKCNESQKLELLLMTIELQSEDRRRLVEKLVKVHSESPIVLSYCQHVFRDRSRICHKCGIKIPENETYGSNRNL